MAENKVPRISIAVPEPYRAHLEAMAQRGGPDRHRGHVVNASGCCRVFNGVLDYRGEQKPKLVRLGLTLADCMARSGPAEAYAE